MANNRYRILEVRDQAFNYLVGATMQLSWSAKRPDLPRGFVEAEGPVQFWGPVHFSSGVRLKRLGPPPCRCARFSFPHRMTEECLTWLADQT